MLESFYHTFGFFGAVFISFFCFSAFIFWVAGIAGIANLPEEKNKNIKLIICIVVPPYPFCWLFYDMYNEWRQMGEKV